MNEEMNEHDSNQENDVGGKEQDSSKYMPQFNSSELSAPIDNSEDRNAEFEFSRKNDDLIWVAQKVNDVRAELAKFVIGQNEMVELLLTGIFANGHILLEGAPGVAKTLSAKVLARSLKVDFSRIQFTPDMMPSDVIGTSIFNMKDSQFTFKKGPIFSNIVLIDEINRAPAKTQAALFEVMEERQITYDGVKYPMSFPFLVIATQNPIEQEGTYALPEAQLDRFMFNIVVKYPSAAEELRILKQTTGSSEPDLEPALTATQILALQEVVRRVPVAEHVFVYARDLVRATRPDEEEAPKFVREYISWGAGPRAGQYLIIGAKARAILEGRFHVSTDDVKAVAHAVLRHRIVANFHADSESVSPDDVIEMLLKKIPIASNDRARKMLGR